MKTRFLVTSCIAVSCSVMANLNLEAQSLFTPSGLIGTSTNINVGINTTNPESPLQVIGALKLGKTTAPVDRVNSQLKFGDGDYVRIGEFEADDKLSFYASQYSFTNGNVVIGANVGIGTKNTIPLAASRLSMQNGWGDFHRLYRTSGTGIGYWGMHNPQDQNCLMFYNQPDDGSTPMFGMLTLMNNGNVGVGTTIPSMKLEVAGNIKMTGSDFILGFNDGRFQGAKTSQRALVHGISSTQDVLVINYAGDFDDGVEVHSDLRVNGRIGLPSVSSISNIFFNSGMVGIGTQNFPNDEYRLRVNGKIICKGLKVQANSWADYVFKPSYALMNLDSLNEFIASNQHLPAIPSEKEIIEKEGFDLEEMNILLLRKVEELTLYTIQMHQRLKELEAKNN